jgi:hypothetical protein
LLIQGQSLQFLVCVTNQATTKAAPQSFFFVKGVVAALWLIAAALLAVNLTLPTENDIRLTEASRPTVAAQHLDPRHIIPANNLPVVPVSVR